MRDLQLELPLAWFQQHRLAISVLSVLVAALAPLMCMTRTGRIDFKLKAHTKHIQFSARRDGTLSLSNLRDIERLRVQGSAISGLQCTGSELPPESVLVKKLGAPDDSRLALMDLVISAEDSLALEFDEGELKVRRDSRKLTDNHQKGSDSTDVEVLVPGSTAVLANPSSLHCAVTGREFHAGGDEITLEELQSTFISTELVRAPLQVSSLRFDQVEDQMLHRERTVDTFSLADITLEYPDLRKDAIETFGDRVVLTFTEARIKELRTTQEGLEVEVSGSASAINRGPDRSAKSLMPSRLAVWCGSESLLPLWTVYGLCLSFLVWFLSPLWKKGA